MMGLFSIRHPLVIPDDSTIRAREREEAKARLEEARCLAEKAEAVAATLRRHNQVNHYARRMEQSFVQGGVAHDD